MTNQTNNSGKPVMLYACSGGANVGEAADLAARRLAEAGEATMFCLAGLGGNVEPILSAARDARVNVVMDGCGVDCGRKTFERCGLANFTHLRATDLGLEKAKGVRATTGQIETLAAAAREAMRAAGA